MDVFTGQINSDVLNLFRDNNILLTNVSPKMTKFYQPLDLTVNGFSKQFMAQNFNDWYTGQVSARLDKGVNIDEIDINLLLSLMKPLHTEWLVDFYNNTTSGTEKKVIDSGWTSSSIKDAVALGLDSLPSIGPFSDIAPLIEIPNGSPPIPNQAVYDVSSEVKSVAYSRDAESSNEEEVWGPADDQNIFNVLDEFDDEQ